MATNTTEPDRPDYVRPEVVDAGKDLCLIRDLLAGTRAMHAKPTEYIPKWADEKDAVHLKRATMEQLYEGLTRTRSAAVGKIFAKPPTIEWGPHEVTLKAHADNIDLRGMKLAIAAKVFAADAIADGYAVILVDHTPKPAGVTVTAANETALNLRPKWAFYTRSAVLSWIEEVVNNASTVVQLVLHEPATVRNGRYGIGSVDRYRVLSVVGGVAGWEVFEKIEDGEGKVTFTSLGGDAFRNRNGQTRGTLPIAVGYTGYKQAEFVAKPPLLPVAFANLGHYQQSSNLRYYRELAAFPMPVVTGTILDAENQPTGAVKMGPGNGLHLEKEGTFVWAELAGTSLEQVEKGVTEKEAQMAKLGLAFLQKDSRAAETAEAHRIDAAAEDSTLSTAAQGKEDAMNLAWEHHGWFLGLPKAECPVVTLNRDYSGTVLSPQAVTALANLIGQGMPIRTAVRTLITGGIIILDDPTDEDILVMEWEAGKKSMQQQEAEDAADREVGLEEAA